VVMFPSSAMLQGPSSNNNPVVELQPGPPFNHKTRGSSSGDVRDSKNLKDGRFDF